MPATDTDLSKLQTTAARLQPFIEALFRGPTNVDQLQLLDRPVEWGAFLKHWEDVFEHAGVALHRILNAYDSVLEQLFESQGSWCAARACDAIWAWSRDNTLTVHTYRPTVTTKTLLLAAAVHNWLWWYRNPDRGASPAPGVDEGAKLSLEQKLRHDVDPLLKAIIRADAPEEGENRESDGAASRGTAGRSKGLDVGDLVAMHIVALNLTSLCQPLCDLLDPPHKARLQRFQTTGALSQLVAAGAHNPGLPRVRTGDWVGIRTLMTELGAAGIRRYLAAELGERAIVDEAGVDEVLGVLKTLHSLDKGAEADRWREGVQTFLAEVLRSTFSERTPDALRQVWHQWICGFPDRVSLAQWCGRLARWSELKSQTQRGMTPAELVWLWRELAMDTIPLWMNGAGEAVLCWGLWLLGYLEDEGPPPLLLTRIASRQSLDQLVSSWRIAVQRAHLRAGYGKEDAGVVRGLEQLKVSLQSLPAFNELVREELTLHRLTAPAADSSDDEGPKPEEEFPPNPNVKVYCY